MEKKTKQLYDLSVCLILFAALDAIEIIFGIFSGAYDISSIAAQVPDAPSEIVMLTKIVLIISIIVITAMMLIQVLIGAKGMAEAKHPSKAKFHIILAIILACVNIIVIISSALSFFDPSTDIWHTVFTLVTSVLDSTILLMFAKTAKSVRTK